ncbi:MAG: hypothetical protein WC868_08660 [Bacteroidales bacterium]
MKTKTFSTLILIVFFILTGAFIFSSCNGKKESTDNSNKKMLTERIQYDVLIKTPDISFDWWVQNIEGSKRESFVKTILDLAYSGKAKVYDYFNEPMTTEQVKAIGNRSETISVMDPDGTNKTYDTIIKHELNIQQISKVRFLEEWYLDEKKLSFDKKVVGVMLMRENYGDSLELRGYTPLFWIYFDDKYPGKMK